jgi:hypothetical protein
MAVTNDERRNTILGQHVRLRSTIRSVVQVAQTSLGASVLSDDMKAATARLQRDVLEHLSDEERLLEPCLSSTDTRATLRISLLRAEHAHQRAALAMLNGVGMSSLASVVAARIIDLCENLLTDMDFEERELLNDTLLPPEVVQAQADPGARAPDASALRADPG